MADAGRPDNDISTQGVTAPQGWRAAGVACGIKVSEKPDLALVVSDAPALAAGMFTTNVMSAAPVRLSRRLLAAGGSFRAVIVNSGNANACTGEAGEIAAREMGEAAAETLGVGSAEVLVASTGVIGVPLPTFKVRAGVGAAVRALSVDGGPAAAEAIMTTDAFAKTAGAELELGGTKVRIGGMGKGAGMIAPALAASAGPHSSAAPHATMISVITTDAAFGSAEVLQAVLAGVVERSFNRISVDGDTSTNDTVLLLANGAAGGPPVDGDPADGARFEEALGDVCLTLAKRIVRDGEGATKVVTYRVRGAADEAEALRAAKTVADSLLVKTALYGRDPNWGRIVAALGRAGVRLAEDVVDVSIAAGGDSIALFSSGRPADFDEAEARALLSAEEITVEMSLGAGSAEADYYGCDLGYEYVKINAEYHT